MERTKRTLVSAHEAALAKGSTTDYDPNRPWNYVWQVVIGDEGFWRDEVTEPGMLILTKVANVGEMVEGDGSVDRQAPGAGPRETQPAPNRLAEVPSGSGHHPRNANRTGRFHRVEGGKYLSNRTGYKICESYNAGQCTETSQGVWCQHNRDTVHQCDRCLGSHPSSRCLHAEMPTPGFLKKNSTGKGKDGKGRGKKGRGRRLQY